MLTLIGLLINRKSGAFFGHAQFHKGRMKGDDPEIDTTEIETPKRFERASGSSGENPNDFR